MTGKTMRIVALALIVMLALTGCNLIRTDPAYIAQQEAEKLAQQQAAYEADMNQIVATFDGGTLTKGEMLTDFEEQYNAFSGYISYNNYFMTMFGGEGYQITVEDVENLRQQVAEEAVTRKVLENKLAEFGLDAISEEDMTAIGEKVNAEFQERLNDYVSSGLDEESAKLYLSYEGVTERMLTLNAIDAELESRLTVPVNAETTVTEDEIVAKYEALVEEDQADAESNIANLENKAQVGDTLYYMPENAKYIKHVFLMADDEVQTARNDAQSTLTSAKSAVSSLESKLSEGEDVAADLEAKKAELSAAEDALKAAEDAVWENVAERLTKVQQGLADGEDFDKLISDYSDDNRHSLEHVIQYGYLVCEGSSQWDAAFLDAVNALDEVGKVSDPVLGSMGVHVILYAADTTAGAAALDDVRAEVEALALTDKQNALYNAAVKGWVEDANVQYDFSGWTL